MCNAVKGIGNEYPVYSCKLERMRISFNFAGVEIAHLHCFGKFKTKQLEQKIFLRVAK